LRSSSSSSSSLSLSDEKQYVVIGNDYGKIKIYNYPCVIEGNNNSGGDNSIPDEASVIGSGHSSIVTNVKFSNTNKSIVSCGGSDRTVILWKIGVAADD